MDTELWDRVERILQTYDLQDILERCDISPETVLFLLVDEGHLSLDELTAEPI